LTRKKLIHTAVQLLNVFSARILLVASSFKKGAYAINTYFICFNKTFKLIEICIFVELTIFCFKLVFWVMVGIELQINKELQANIITCLILLLVYYKKVIVTKYTAFCLWCLKGKQLITLTFSLTLHRSDHNKQQTLCLLKSKQKKLEYFSSTCLLDIDDVGSLLQIHIESGLGHPIFWSRFVQVRPLWEWVGKVDGNYPSGGWRRSYGRIDVEPKKTIIRV
jgi:hypothetical protein